MLGYTGAMNSFRTIAQRAVLALSMASLLASPISPVSPAMAGEAGTIVVAQSDCHAIGMRQAAQVGGQLARATPENRGGQRVCVIVVLMPAKDGQRPRRSEIVVPMG